MATAKLLPDVKPSAEREIDACLAACDSGMDVLSECFGSDIIEVGRPARVRDSRWAEWLEVAWGFDSDTASLFSLVKQASSDEEMRQMLCFLPTVQEPSGVVDLADERLDAHLHAGGIPVPSLVWASILDFGLSWIEDPRDQASNPYEVNPDASVRKALEDMRRHAIVGRLLMRALELTQIFAEPGPANKTDGVPSTKALIEAVTRALLGMPVRSLVALLKRSVPAQSARLPTFDVRNRLWDAPNALEALIREREVVAKGTWRWASGYATTIETELLACYLRCKNLWFRTSSGGDEYTGLTYFREATVLSRAWRNNNVPVDFVNRLADGVAAAYAVCGWPSHVHIRLPHKNAGEIPNAIHWLRRTFTGVTVKVVLCFRREMFHQTRLFAQMCEFARVAGMECGNAGFEIVGIDIVGHERYLVLADWLETVVRFRNHLAGQIGQRPNTILHLGEDTNGPIEGLCNIWSAARHCDMGSGDRIAHGLDLLAPARRGGSGQMTLSTRQYEGLRNILEEMGNEIDRGVWREYLLDFEVRGTELIRLRGRGYGELLSSLTRLVLDELIGRGVAIEVCPTSNWRIGRLDGPLPHPVREWAKDCHGQYLIGTDDPSVFPCTIAAEHFTVAASVSS